MRNKAIKFSFLFSMVLSTVSAYSQTTIYQNYKFIGESIEDFEPVKSEMVSALVLGSIKKDMKKYLKGKPDTILYSIAPNRYVCACFVGKRYENTYIIVDNYGKLQQTIICMNPEFHESNVIYEYANENEYNIRELNSPFGSVRKNMTILHEWYEAFVYKTGVEDFAYVLIFNKNLEFIAIEKAR